MPTTDYATNDTSLEITEANGNYSPLQQQQQQQQQSGTFNALNVTNSPRLSRNSRRAKLNHKRQQNDEKRIERQRREQRSRTSQELARKLDEIRARSEELEREGGQLEVLVSACEGRWVIEKSRDGLLSNWQLKTS